MTDFRCAAVHVLGRRCELGRGHASHHALNVDGILRRPNAKDWTTPAAPDLEAELARLRVDLARTEQQRDGVMRAVEVINRDYGFTQKALGDAERQLEALKAAVRANLRAFLGGASVLETMAALAALVKP